MSMPYSYQSPRGYQNGHIPGQGQGNMYPNSYPGVNHVSSQNGLGFTFRKRYERLDWRKIACADVDNISRNMDFNTLQENIMNITFCNIEAELDMRTIDPNFVKLFKLAQLTIEYLLHSQEFLASTVSTLEEKLKKAIEEHEETKKSIEKQKEELSEVKKESHKRKKMLTAQQHMIQAGASNYHKCQFCSKAFVNITFYQSHISRRHPDQSSSILPQFVQSAPVTPAANPALEKELMEIKERLRMTESQLQDEKNMRNSLNQKEKANQAKKEHDIHNDMEEWKQTQLQSQKNEIDKMRDMFMGQLKEMTEKYMQTQQVLEEVQKQRMPGSGLGVIKDDLDQETLDRQKEELQQMVLNVQTEMDKVKRDTDDRLLQQEDIWREKMMELGRDHREELKNLNAVMEKASSQLDNERVTRGAAQNQYQEELENLRQQQKDVQKRMKEKDRQMAELAARPPVVASREPPIQKSQPIRSAAAAPPPVKSQMMPDEEEDSSEYDTTLGNTAKSISDRNDTLSLTGTMNNRSNRLLEQLKNDPTIIDGMRNELTAILNEDLERMGIPKGSTGIKADVWSKQMEILKTKRQQIGKKHKNFFDIRMQYITEVEQMAREKMQKSKSVKPPGHGMARSPPKSYSRDDLSNTFNSTGQLSTQELAGYQGRRQMAPSANLARGKSVSAEQIQSHHTPTRGQDEGRQVSTLPRNYGSREPPKPAPRSTSPRNKMMATATSMSSTGNSQTFNSTGTGSQWESDEDSYFDEDIPDGAKPRVSFSPQHQQHSKRPRQPQQHRIPYAEDEEDSEWDSASELQELSPSKVTSNESQLKTPKKAVPGPQKSYQPPVKSSSNQAKGEKVANLTKSIEEQLNHRAVKKPAGAVDIMGTKNVSNRKGTVADDFDDDDDFSISSLEDNVPSHAPPARRSTGRQSTATDMSNTYGSSQWGSSSRVDMSVTDRPPISPRRSVTRGSDTYTESTINKGPRGSVGKSSLVSVTDFDDDDDYEYDHRRK